MMTLGRVIRACRLGWYVASGMNAWMRVSGDSERIIVELAPLDDRPPGRTQSPEYRCIGVGYGASEVDPDLIELSPVLRSIRNVKRAFSVVLDSEGRIIQ